MPRLILDATGGELGPRVLLEGAAEAFPKLEGELVLIGKSDELHALLAQPDFAILTGEGALGAPSPVPQCRVRIIDCSDCPPADLSTQAPTRALEQGLCLVAEGRKTGLPSAFVSTAPADTVLAASLRILTKTPGVSSPAFAVRLPTVTGKDCILLDTGATPHCSPGDLRDFAVMGALYAQLGLEKGALPRVAILGRTVETLTQWAHLAEGLLQADPFFQTGARQQAVFAGFAEGGDLLKGHIDVVVTGGGLGTLVLRAMEGASAAVIGMVQEAAQRTLRGSIGLRLASDFITEAQSQLQHAEFVTALLLGIRGSVTVCQPRSNAKAIRNALLNTQHVLRSRLTDLTEDTFALTSSPSATEQKGTQT